MDGESAVRRLMPRDAWIAGTTKTASESSEVTANIGGRPHSAICSSSPTSGGKGTSLLERPNNGALKWLSSAQINERLHAISHSRIRGAWGQTGRDVPLKPGDFLVSMLGFTEVKLARYDGPPNDATRSIYLLRSPQKRARSERDSAAVWFALTCDDFTDQLRMELSDRVMKPLAEHFLGDICLPPLPAALPPEWLLHLTR